GLAEELFRNVSVTSLRNSGDVTLARISPDGRYLAYVSNQDGRYSIWVRQIANSSAVQVLPSQTDPIWDAAFTPDGAYVEYMNQSLQTSAKILRIPALGGPPRPVPIEESASVPSYSSDGKQMAYSVVFQNTNQSRLMIANADGTAPH